MLRILRGLLACLIDSTLWRFLLTLVSAVVGSVPLTVGLLGRLLPEGQKGTGGWHPISIFGVGLIGLAVIGAELSISYASVRRNQKRSRLISAAMQLANSQTTSTVIGTVCLVTLFFAAEISKRLGLTGVLPLSTGTTLLLSGVIAGMVLRNLIMNYRISQGLFGNNEAEARELVAFILRHRNRFDGDGQNFRLFDESDAKEVTALASDVAMGVRHA